VKLMRALATPALFISLAACSSFGPKPQVVYHRPDIKSQATKVIILPVTDFAGKKTDGAKDIEMGIVSGFASMYGQENIIPAGPVIEKLNQSMGDRYGSFIKTLDATSAIEQMHKDPKMREYISKVTSTVGDYNLAVAIVDGGKAEYEAGTPVHIHLGYFDTKNLTWKWITKIEDKKGPIGNWVASSTAMVTNSFETAKKVDKATENMARMPASK
jgi:hypothetical protein